MLFNLISTLMICISIYVSFLEFRRDSSILKEMYLKRKIDYLWAFLMALIGVTSIAVLSTSNLPTFLTWSWLSIFNTMDGSPQSATNMTLQPFAWDSIIATSLFWIILSFSLPYLAKLEEEVYRSNKLGLRERIKSSIFFGFAHIFMGVNLVAVFVIGITGFIYSIFYKRAYLKSILKGTQVAEEEALLASTSIHTKYNFILVTLVAIISILMTIKN